MNLTFENPPLEQIFEVMKKYGFVVFDGKTGGSYYDYDLNLLGIRNANVKSDAFDDKYIVYYKVNKKWDIYYFSCTTDPGKAHLMNPIFDEAKKDGALILKHGEQYRSAYTLGFHGGGNWRHRALIQTGKLKGFRDNNRDDILDLDPTSVTEGLYGANHHTAFLTADATVVGAWSAGCQVINKHIEYKKLIDLWERAAKIWGSTFSYTLLHQKDFE